jgi:DnaK suppressor protein
MVDAQSSFATRSAAGICDGTTMMSGHAPVCEATLAGTPRSVDSGDLDLADVERRLRARQATLQARIAGFAAPPERGAELGFGKRIGDGTTEAVSRITDVGVGGSLELSEARVARALAKLEEGTYGVCDRCGRPIAPPRLAAAPESARCIDCARHGA